MATKQEISRLTQNVWELFNAGYLHLTASAVNNIGNSGAGVYSIALTDHTAEPTVYTIDIASGATSSANFLYSIDSSATASIAFYTETNTDAGFSLQISSSVAGGDATEVTIFNDFHNAYSYAEEEVAALPGSDDSAYWVNERAVRYLRNMAYGQLLVNAFDISRDSGEKMNLSQRAKALLAIIQHSDAMWIGRCGLSHVTPEDADVCFDMEAQFDETRTGALYDVEDEY